jgi:8-oxo-dGTP pyrophosphatase MutT (NUDIX family)
MAEAPTHAGGVVFRRDADGILYLLVSSSDGNHWVLPKGHIEPEEASPWAAAKRELREEAGVEGEYVAHLSLRRYRKPDAEEVLVLYFLVEATGSTQAAETRSLLWVCEDEASRVLTFEETREVLREGASVLRRLEGSRS